VTPAGRGRVRLAPTKIFPAPKQPSELLSSFSPHLHSTPRCPLLVHKQAQQQESSSFAPRRTSSPEQPILLLAGLSKPHPQRRSRAVPDPSTLRLCAPPESGQSTATAPSCPGSPLPQLHQQSHQQVNGYICVICISHPTQTTSDTSRLSSCNHFAYRGNLVAPTSAVTANTPPSRRMSR
jgi:hypothetical protein